MEKIGFGKFQIRILLMVGFFTVSMFDLVTLHFSKDINNLTPGCEASGLAFQTMC